MPSSAGLDDLSSHPTLASSASPELDPAPPARPSQDELLWTRQIHGVIGLVLCGALSITAWIQATDDPPPSLALEELQAALNGARRTYAVTPDGHGAVPPAYLLSRNYEEVIWHTGGALRLHAPWKPLAPPFVALSRDPIVLSEQLPTAQIHTEGAWTARSYMSPSPSKTPSATKRSLPMANLLPHAQITIAPSTQPSTPRKAKPTQRRPNTRTSKTSRKSPKTTPKHPKSIQKHPNMPWQKPEHTPRPTSPDTQPKPPPGIQPSTATAPPIRVCDQYRFGRWFCGPQPWHFVGVVEMNVHGRSTSCIWMHPHEKAELRLTFPQVPWGRRFKGQITLSDETAGIAQGGAVTLRIEADGHEVYRRVHPNRRGWSSLQVDLGAAHPDLQRPHPPTVEVTFVVTAPRTGQRHVCLRGDFQAPREKSP
ncbi:MAG: hypothetical protein AAFX99_16535 [Myxococcota bacterium]